MRLQGSTSFSEEQKQEEETAEMEQHPSGEDNILEHPMEADIDQTMANLFRQFPQDTAEWHQPFATGTLEGACRYDPPPRTLSPVPATIQVPSPASNEQQPHGLPPPSIDVPAPSRVVDDFPYLGQVSEASSTVLEAETSQESDSRDCQRNFHPWPRHQIKQRQTGSHKKTTAMAAGIATSILMTILFGFHIGLMAGLFAAYAHDKEGILGDISRAVGELALITHQKATDINTRHKLVRRVKFALMIGWESATNIDRKKNAFMNMIVHGDVVLTNLVDAFQVHPRFHDDVYSFFEDEDEEEDEDMNDQNLNDHVNTTYDMEPIDLSLNRARY